MLPRNCLWKGDVTVQKLISGACQFFSLDIIVLLTHDLLFSGVIFYGMVVGELPFLTNKNKNIPTQQRRKKLIDQINKGLGVSHQRALMYFSRDFKSMMSTLLVADFRKRITARNLMFHAWITDKGSKNIRSHRFKQLDIHTKALVSIINNRFKAQQFVIKCYKFTCNTHNP